MLNLIFLALAVIMTAVIYLAAPALSFWWLLPILIGAFVGVIVLYFVFLIVASLFMPRKKPIKKPNPFCHFMIWITMDWLMKLFRIHIEVKGEELLPKEPCVIVSNHLSDFDPMAVLAVMPKRKIGYICKEAILKLPIVGPFIYHAGFLSIDRNNGVRAVRTLQRAAELMTNAQTDIGIYPEGTRSRTGELLRFKPGAFTLAQDAKAPIVLMTTKGTDKVAKNIPFRATKVELEFFHVIDRETVLVTPVKELCDSTRALIEEHLK